MIHINIEFVNDILSIFTWLLYFQSSRNPLRTHFCHAEITRDRSSRTILLHVLLQKALLEFRSTTVRAVCQGMLTLLHMALKC